MLLQCLAVIILSLACMQSCATKDKPKNRKSEVNSSADNVDDEPEEEVEHKQASDRTKDGEDGVAAAVNTWTTSDHHDCIADVLAVFRAAAENG